MGILIYLIGVVLPVGLNVYVWYRLRHAFGGPAMPRWRRPFAYLGLGTSFLACAIPWALFVYMYVLFNRGRPVDASEIIDSASVLDASICVAGLSFIFGALSPEKVRVHLMVSATCAAFFGFFFRVISGLVIG